MGKLFFFFGGGGEGDVLSFIGNQPLTSFVGGSLTHLVAIIQLDL